MPTNPAVRTVTRFSVQNTAVKRRQREWVGEYALRTSPLTALTLDSGSVKQVSKPGQGG